MDKVFLEAPQAIAGALVGLIAKAAGLEFGKSLADEIAGACYEADRAESCLTEVGEIYRVSNGVGQCCNMGKAVACSERCMMDIEPEKPNDEKCKSNIDDLINTTYQLYPPDEIENGGCCNVVENNNCLSCRPINANQWAKCRKDEELKEVQGLTVCCHKEKYIAGETKREGMCCTTVLECVSYKFADALEVVAEMLADGIIPLDSLTGR